MLDGSHDQVAERSQTDFLYGLRRIAAFGEQTRYYGADARGSVRSLTDERGRVTTTSSYDAWGKPKDASPSNSPLANLFGFTGERQDAASGLVYLRARWYSPDTGQFISRDPLRGLNFAPQTLAPYTYAFANPLSFVDRSGLSPSALFSENLGSLPYTTPAWSPIPRPTPQPEPGPAPAAREVRTELRPSALFGAAAIVAAATDTLHEAAKSLRTRASGIGRALRVSDDPAVRSQAGRLLRGAGELSAFAKSGVFRAVGSALPWVSLGVEVVSGLSKGEDPGEAALRAALRAGGGVVGVLLGTAVCGGETVATSGFGVVACPALVVAGSVGGAALGDRAGDLIFGPE